MYNQTSNSGHYFIQKHCVWFSFSNILAVPKICQLKILVSFDSTLLIIRTFKHQNVFVFCFVPLFNSNDESIITTTLDVAQFSKVLELISGAADEHRHRNRKHSKSFKFLNLHFTLFLPIRSKRSYKKNRIWLRAFVVRRGKGRNKSDDSSSKNNCKDFLCRNNFVSQSVNDLVLDIVGIT